MGIGAILFGQFLVLINLSMGNKILSFDTIRKCLGAKQSINVGDSSPEPFDG